MDAPSSAHHLTLSTYEYTPLFPKCIKGAKFEMILNPDKQRKLKEEGLTTNYRAVKAFV